MNITLEDIFVTFDAKTLREMQAIKGINLEINAEDRITIIGNNNVGKTVLLRLIAGRINPTFGKIYFERQDVASCNAIDLQKRCFFISQDYEENASDELTILENIVLSTLPESSNSLFKKAITQERIDIINTCIERYGFLGIDKILNKYIVDVQKYYIYALSLVIATLRRPKVLLVDNITYGLPQDIANELLSVMKRIVQDQKMTLVSVMNNPKDEFDFFNRCIIMGHGNIGLDLSGEAKEKFDFSKIFDCFDILPKIKLDN